MKLKLLAPVLCVWTITLACQTEEPDDKGDGSGATAGEAPASGGEAPGSGGNEAGSGGKDGVGGSKPDASGGEGGAQGGQGGGRGSRLVLTATDFESGDELPDEYTCEGKEFGDGISPELSWEGAAEGTQTYALVFADTTLLELGLPQFGYHWVAWNIPVDVTGLPKELTGDEFPEQWDGGQQFRAGPPVGHNAFFGPCPSWQFACQDATPRSHDHYAITLYTFDRKLTAPEFDEANFTTYAHQLAEFFESKATDSTQLLTASDAAPGDIPTVPACPAFSITATDFDYGEALPDANTCEGKEFGDGASPELSWSNPPEGTTHYALVFQDRTLIDAGLPQFGYHWAAWNIPVSVAGLVANLGTEDEPSGLSGGRQFSAAPAAADPGFFGPCPSWMTACDSTVPRSNDTYAFILYAYDGELEVPDFDDTNYANYVHQLDLFFASASPLGKTGLLASSDAAPGVEPTIPACPESP